MAENDEKKDEHEVQNSLPADGPALTDFIKEEKKNEEAEIKATAPAPVPEEKPDSKEEEKKDPKEEEYQKTVNRINELTEKSKKPSTMEEALAGMLEMMTLAGYMFAEMTGIKKFVNQSLADLKGAITGLFNKNENDDKPATENTAALQATGNTKEPTDEKATIVKSLTEKVNKIDSNQPNQNAPQANSPEKEKNEKNTFSQ